jgi:hypothetical protein
MLKKLIGLFSGFDTFKLTLIGLGLVSVVVGALYVSSVLRDRDQLIEEKKELLISNQRLSADLVSAQRTISDNIAALDEYEKRLQSSKELWSQSEKELKKLNETDAVVCDWGSDVVPDAVWGWLCSEAPALP